MEFLKVILKQWVWSALILIFFIPLPSRAEDSDSQLQLYEQKIKAGLIYNFLKYTEWPSDKMSTNMPSIVICLIGIEDPFNGYLEPIEERTVNQRHIKIKHVSSAQEIDSCHLLFVPESERARWNAWRGTLEHKSILTVGDFDQFADEGGMIQFGNKDSHIYVELNIKAISTAHLVIYNNLRRLSRTTHPPSNGL